MKQILIAITTALSVAAAEQASGQDIVTGWEGDTTHGYAFVAPTAAFDLSPSQSLLVRGSASYLYYASRLGGPTDVKAPGGAAVLGYRVTTPRVTGAVVAGFEARRIFRTTSVASPANWERGVSLSGELFVNPSRLTRLSALGNYGHAARYSWMRTSIQRQLSNQDFSGPRAVSLGAEFTAQGNRDVRGHQIGGVLEISWMAARSSLQIRGGYSQSQYSRGGHERTGYFGVGLYRHL